MSYMSKKYAFFSEDVGLIVYYSSPLNNTVESLDESQVCGILLKVVLSILLIFEIHNKSVRESALLAFWTIITTSR